jgi:hypothetical protein
MVASNQSKIKIYLVYFLVLASEGCTANYFITYNGIGSFEQDQCIDVYEKNIAIESDDYYLFLDGLDSIHYKTMNQDLDFIHYDLTKTKFNMHLDFKSIKESVIYDSDIVIHFEFNQTIKEFTVPEMIKAKVKNNVIMVSISKNVLNTKRSSEDIVILF